MGNRLKNVLLVLCTLIIVGCFCIYGLKADGIAFSSESVEIASIK